MYSSTIHNENGLDLTSTKFQTAFAFLKRGDLATLPEGWAELGDGVRASVQHYTTQPENELTYETHEKFFDIQYLVQGTEWLGCVDRTSLTVKTPYNELNDVTFYQTPALHGGVLLHDGDYVIFAPEDAHQPRCMAGCAMPVIKIVVKVPV